MNHGETHERIWFKFKAAMYTTAACAFIRGPRLQICDYVLCELVYTNFGYAAFKFSITCVINGFTLHIEYYVLPSYS